MQSPDHDDDPGAAWMLAWRAGDEAAFDRLVERYSAQVWALLTRFLGRHPGREDMVQEVFLRVVRSRERYEPRARFTTWLYRIVFNLCVNETQRGGGREFTSLGEGEEEAGGAMLFADETEEGPSAHMEQSDVVRLVRRAIAGLPAPQRMALVLAKYHEMPYVEIGKVLGSTEKAVKSLVHRAREALRANLEPVLRLEELS
jgi:RNA polymerase sigma-70 factor (ECF subfamily)